MGAHSTAGSPKGGVSDGGLLTTASAPNAISVAILVSKGMGRVKARVITPEGRKHDGLVFGQRVTVADLKVTRGRRADGGRTALVVALMVLYVTGLLASPKHWVTVIVTLAGLPTGCHFGLRIMRGHFFI